MALTLKYRNGFIDAEAEMPQPLQSDLPRASSLPPKMSKMVQVEEFLQEEESSQTYVQMLSENLSNPLDRSPLAPGRTRTGAHSPSTEMVRLSGSIGHPELCRRPCIFWMAGHCQNSAGCSFCHLTHEKKVAKPDKKQRSFLQSLSHREFFGLISHFCHEKATLLNITQEAGEVLKILQEEAVFSLCPMNVPGHLLKVLAQMTFSHLITLAINSLAREEGHSMVTASRVSEEFDELRACMRTRDGF
ncbi:unnamed protein product [Durusdinium trenchii]|uniref:Uncharacterized protein n=2 Tax=Durusdinium trenchii TaxID=1381693 RepID=A0ABP0HC64_9DINO